MRLFIACIQHKLHVCPLFLKKIPNKSQSLPDSVYHARLHHLSAGNQLSLEVYTTPPQL